MTVEQMIRRLASFPLSWPVLTPGADEAFFADLDAQAVVFRSAPAEDHQSEAAAP